MRVPQDGEFCCSLWKRIPYPEFIGVSDIGKARFAISHSNESGNFTPQLEDTVLFNQE